MILYFGSSVRTDVAPVYLGGREENLIAVVKPHQIVGKLDSSLRPNFVVGYELQPRCWRNFCFSLNRWCG